MGTCTLCHLSCVPKKGPKEGHPAKILYAKLGRPRYISETRPPRLRRDRSGSDSPKCFTLGLGRPAKFPHGNKRKRDRRIADAVVKHGYLQREIADHPGLNYATISRLVSALVS